MKQLNLCEAQSLRRALRPAAGLALSALLTAFGCSTADTSDQPRSILPNGHLRSTARVSTSERIEPLRSLDPLGAAVATSAASLPANNYRANRSLPPGGVARLGASNPAAGPAGGSQVPANSNSMYAVREVTVNSSIANPYGAEAIVNGGDGGILVGGITAGAVVAPVTSGVTGVAGPGMGIGVATAPGFGATSGLSTSGSLTVPAGVAGVGTLGINGVAGPGSSSSVSSLGVGVAGPVSPGVSATSGTLTTSTGTTSLSTGSVTQTGGTGTARLVAPRTAVTGFTSTSTTTGTAAAAQPQTSNRSRFRIVNFFRRGSTNVTVQPTQ